MKFCSEVDLLAHAEHIFEIIFVAVMHTRQTSSNICVALNQVFASNKQCIGKSSILSKVDYNYGCSYKCIIWVDVNLSVSQVEKRLHCQSARNKSPRSESTLVLQA